MMLLMLWFIVGVFFSVLRLNIVCGFVVLNVVVVSVLLFIEIILILFVFFRVRLMLNGLFSFKKILFIVVFWYWFELIMIL